MKAFPLKILTPSGPVFEGRAELLTLRALSGKMGVLADHIDCIAPVVPGTASVTADGQKMTADCGRGVLQVAEGNVTLAVNSFRWQKPAQ